MWEVKLWFSGRKEGRKKYCFDCWWCNIDHLQFLCFNLLLYVFQIKTYTDDDWFLIWLFPLLSELFYLGIQATDITSLCLNLRFGLEPKHLTSYPNRVPSFLKLCISHSSHSLLISTFFYFFFPALLPDSSFFQGYHLSFLGYFCFFHLAILSGWSLEILDDCRGFLDIWQSIWNRMGNFIRVSAHMQMMPPAHVEAIAQIPGALVCRVCATQVVLRWMVIPACLRRASRSESAGQWTSTGAAVSQPTGLTSCTRAALPVPNTTGCCTDNPISSFHSTSGLLSPLPFTLFPHPFLPGATAIWGFISPSDTLGTEQN